MIGGLKRLLSSVSRLGQTAEKLEDVADELGTLQTLFHSQAAFIRAHQTVSDIGEPTLDVMKCYQNVWLPLEESRFPLWMKDGEYQKHLYDAALPLVQNRDVAVDVGANVGFFSKNMVKDFREVHAFEPVWFVRACLARNVRGNCIIYPFALSDICGEDVIETTPIVSGGGQIGGAASLARRHPMRQTIRLVTLDSLNIPRIDFLKIDVQGHEARVLAGARETLARGNAVVLCEFELEGRENSAIGQVFTSLGYECAKRIGKDGIFVRAR